MDKTKTEKFGEWITQQMNKRAWKKTELATRPAVSKQVISKYINNPPEKPDNNVLIGFANALNLSKIVVFRAAGILHEEPEYVTLLDE